MPLRIYKIVDDTTGNCYIGSTKKTLRERLKEHERDMIYWMEGKFNWITSFEILNNNDYHIELVEEIEEYEDRNQIEGIFIRVAQNCVNKHVMGRSQKEWYEVNKDRVKQYYEQNKAQIFEYKKNYREQNKEQIKQKMNQKVECECGGCYTMGNRAQHFKTKKHLRYINTNI